MGTARKNKEKMGLFWNCTMDCKSVYSGSIPDEASKFSLKIKRNTRNHRLVRRTRRHNIGHSGRVAFHGLF